MPNMVYKVEGTAGPKKKDYFSLKEISSKLGVMRDITPTSLHLKPVMHDVKSWSFLYSIRVFHSSPTCGPTFIPTLQSWKSEVGPFFLKLGPKSMLEPQLRPQLCIPTLLSNSPLNFAL